MLISCACSIVSIQKRTANNSLSRIMNAMKWWQWHARRQCNNNFQPPVRCKHKQSCTWVPVLSKSASGDFPRFQHRTLVINTGASPGHIHTRSKKLNTRTEDKYSSPFPVLLKRKIRGSCNASLAAGIKSRTRSKPHTSLIVKYSNVFRCKSAGSLRKSNPSLAWALHVNATYLTNTSWKLYKTINKNMG